MLSENIEGIGEKGEIVVTKVLRHFGFAEKVLDDAARP